MTTSDSSISESKNPELSPQNEKPTITKTLEPIIDSNLNPTAKEFVPRINTAESIAKETADSLNNLENDELVIPAGANTDTISELLGEKLNKYGRKSQFGGELISENSNIDIVNSDPYESLDKNSSFYQIEKNKVDLLNDSLFFNNDILLQIAGLLSDPELFNEFYTTIYGGNLTEAKNFIDLFFIDINDYISSKGNRISDDQNIITYLDGKVNLKSQDLIVRELKTIIERDTYHYNNLITNNQSDKMFIYTAIVILANEEAWFISKNETNAKGYLQLFIQIRKKIEQLVNQFQTVLKSQKGTIRETYEKFINKRNKVFTFIKERNDDINIGRNPRFKMSTLKDDNKSLKMDYINVDGQVSGRTVSDKKNKLIEIMKKENKKEEQYVLGPFNGVFLADKRLSNRQIAEQIESPIFEKLFKLNEDFCMIGYGQSGSGKTSTLIYFDKTEEDGIVTELCNLNQFVANVEEISMILTNIYLQHGSGTEDMSRFKDEFYKTAPIKLGKEDPVFKYGEAIRPGKPPKKMWFMEEEDQNGLQVVKSIGAYIAKAFDMREVEPTPNNPNSSRSHVVITLFLKLRNGSVRRLIVCDLAGVENVFACESNTEILKFSEQYKNSNDYGDKGNKPVKLDRYTCNQANIQSLNVTESRNYSLLQPELNTLASSHTNAVKAYKANKGIQTGGDGCDIDEPNAKFITGCSTGFLFQDLHNGMTSTPEWDDLKLKIKDLMEPFLLSYRLTHIAKNYTKATKNKRLMERLNQIYDEIYDKVKTHGYSLYPGVDSGKKTMANGKVVLINQSPALDYNTLELAVTKSFGSIIKDQAYEESLKDPKKKGKVKSVIQNMKVPTLSADQMTIKNKKGKVLWSTTNSSAYELYLQILCEEYRIETLKYNCVLRRNEGFMINKSLYDLRQDVKSIIMSTLQPLPDQTGKSYMPIFWDRLVLPYCRNLNTDDEVLLKYYSSSKPEPTPLGGKILKVMDADNRTFLNQQPTDYLDLESFRSMNFGIFTVINTTNNERTNNPPNPPYININRLKYYTLVKFNPEILKKEILDIALNKMKTYEYYTKSNKNFEKYINKLEMNSNLENKSKDVIKNMGIALIELIETANPSTLIGSLESTLIIQNVTYDELTCTRDEKREEILNRFSKIGVTPYQTPNSFKNKYLKYKKKYMIELKKLGKL